MDQPFEVVQSGDSFVIEGPDIRAGGRRRISSMTFATRDLAEDIAVCMRYAYAIGRADSAEEIVAEIRGIKVSNVKGEEWGKET